MKTPTDLNITIPAAIVALPDLNLSERVALAHIAVSAGCLNASLAKLLGASVRGAEDILHRLRAKGLIRQIGQGRARQLALTFPVEHHANCGDKNKGDSHELCVVDALPLAVTKPEMSTQDFIGLELSVYRTCLEYGDYEHARNHLVIARERLEVDVKFPAEIKAQMINELKQQEDRCFAFHCGAQMAKGRPSSEQREIALASCRATPEKLALFRERMESGITMGNGENIVLLSGEPSGATRFSSRR